VTASGARVRVYVSSAYTDADAAVTRWASFLAALPHERELELLEAYVAPLAEVERICGRGALGCYGQQTLVSIGELVHGVTPEDVVRHEYGHHVAANRLNPPWEAVEWGPKRWASAANVCARAAVGTAYPGNEAAYYTLNPGEAFAEAYRVTAELDGGPSGFTWNLVDPSFAPGPEAIAAVREDVLRPWANGPVRVVRARFAGGTRTWTLPLKTTLDGNLEVALEKRAGARHSLQLVDGAGRVLAGTTAKTSLRFTICGQRTLTVRVRRSGSVRFGLRVLVP
jgi:hypothetical protein